MYSPFDLIKSEFSVGFGYTEILLLMLDLFMDVVEQGKHYVPPQSIPCSLPF